MKVGGRIPDSSPLFFVLRTKVSQDEKLPLSEIKLFYHFFENRPLSKLKLKTGRMSKQKTELKNGAGPIIKKIEKGIGVNI